MYMYSVRAKYMCTYMYTHCTYNIHVHGQTYMHGILIYYFFVLVHITNTDQIVVTFKSSGCRLMWLTWLCFSDVQTISNCLQWNAVKSHTAKVCLGGHELAGH